ncbi:MAG: AAA family ATPase [bacterium]|nr:AAA family ATPase [bacterium]
MDNKTLPGTSNTGENPYIYNIPVQGSDFIGRRKTIDKLLRETVLGRTQGNVWLTGEKKMGKTSLLKNIENQYANFDHKIKPYGFEGELDVAFLYLNLETIGPYQAPSLLNLQLPINYENIFFSKLRESLEARFNFQVENNEGNLHGFVKTMQSVLLNAKYYIVFLLDGFDIFLENFETNEQLISFLNAQTRLFLGGSRLPGVKPFSCLFASQLTYKEVLKKNGIPKAGPGLATEYIELPPFSNQEVKQVADFYLKDNPVEFSKKDIDLCYELTGGHPYFVQKFFSIIYEQRTRNTVDYLPAALKDYTAAFKETLAGWDYPNVNERTRETLKNLEQAVLNKPPLADMVRKELPAPQKQAEFYINAVKLENIQGFETLTADLFSTNGKPHMFSLLLGDNSSGKTSFLRCLALGICDEGSAVALLNEYRGKFIHNGRREGYIHIDLTLSGKKHYRIITKVKQTQKREEVEKEYYTLSPRKKKATRMETKDFPWDDLFICGYGAGRVLGERREAYEEYRMNNAMDTLFRYDQPMQDPELSLRRIGSHAGHKAYGDKEAEEAILRDLLGLLKNLFMFTGDEKIELTGKGMEVVTSEKRSLLRAHGDGYKNTSGWVMDFITWNMLAGRQLNPSSISGIVLLDEIEQHLHPKWQRHIIQLLRKEFPGVQFIAATHSPLCTSGITDLEENEYQVLRFHKTGNEPADVHTVSSLRGLRADQILTSEAFDLPTTRNPEIAGKLTRFRELYLNESRSQKEESQFRDLGTFLKQVLPGTIDDEETKLMRKKLEGMLKEVVNEKEQG